MRKLKNNHIYLKVDNETLKYIEDLKMGTKSDAVRYLIKLGIKENNKLDNTLRYDV